MLPISEIVKHSTAKPFERGKKISELDGSVSNRTFNRFDDGNEIRGTVISSKRLSDDFKACVVVDDACEHILEYECTCPANARGGSMCKHCVALAFTFRSDPESFQGVNEERSLNTDSAIQEEIERAKNRKRSKANRPIRLIPILSKSFGIWYATFKVTDGKSTYIVSDLDSFANAFKNRSLFEYGKKLAFVHESSAFENDSAQIAAFIANAILVRHMLAGTSSKRKSSERYGKEIELTSIEVAELLDILGTGELEFKDADNGEPSKTVRIENGNPNLRINIAKYNDGEYQLIGLQNVTAVKGSNTYIFDDEIVYRTTAELNDVPFILSSNKNDSQGHIEAKDIKDFCEHIIPQLASVYDIEYPPELEKFIAKRADISFYLDKLGTKANSRVELSLKVKYGNSEAELLGPESNENAPILDNDAYRDEDAENNAIEIASKYFDSSMSILLKDSDRLGDLLFEGLNEFERIGNVFTTPAFDRLLASKDMRVQVGISLAGNLIDLDISTDDITREELAAVLSSLRRKKHYHLLKNGSIVSLQNSELERLGRLMEDLQISASELLDDSFLLPTYQSIYLDREYPDALRSEAFEEYIRKLDTPFDQEFETPPSLNGTLRPYQEQGFKWLSNLASLGMSGILADEMGLGKTLQIIALLQSYEDKGQLHRPSLIICPASLVYNWSDEIVRFAPNFNVCLLDGDKSSRKAKLAKQDFDILITSYDIARIEANELTNIEFEFAIIDEAQYIKNHGTKTTRAVKNIKANHKFALSGTPIENKLSELWSIFDFLMPGLFGSYSNFRERFELDVIGGDDQAVKKLNAIVSPFILRRLKSSVLNELPEKSETVLHVAMTNEQSRIYHACEQNLREELNIQKRTNASRKSKYDPTLKTGKDSIAVLAELMKLRQISLDPSLVFDNYKGDASKETAIMGLIAQAIETDRKVLVFSQFTSYLDILKKRLESASIPYYMLTGSTPKSRRLELVNEFNSNDIPVFLISLKAGGVGLNLTGAEVVIHADPWWNASAMNQATDRVHRIGQTKPVDVYKIISKGTIEERIEALQAKKSQLAEDVISENSIDSLSHLSAKELSALLFD